jgi:argininosuccinate lyase
VGLWAGGFATEFRDDAASLRRLLERVATCPLGSAAGYGVPFLPLDREATSRELGFDGAQEPVTACQLSRGKAEASFAFEASLLLQDIGRMASDLCLYATSEFAFVRLPQEFTTGSSIMPQKRNPDVFELLRARSAQASADLLAVLNVPVKLTSGYHRDLQLIKAPLFRMADAASACTGILTHALSGVRFDPERCAAAMDPSLYATEEACKLVLEDGLPFRDAYQRIAARYGQSK